MPRDLNGLYTLPVGNPVVSGTIIESVWANLTMTDIANALSDSLSRTGLGAMLSAFKFADGTMGAPGISWINEPTSGFHRDALNSFWYSVGNEDVLHITKDGIELAPGKTILGFTGGGVIVQDPEPVAPVPPNGQQWFESDTGAMYMRYKNPDLTYTWIQTNTTGVIVNDAPLRVTSVVSSATPTPNADTTDLYILTALAVNATFGAPTGTPSQGQSLLIRIKDNGTPRTLAFNAVYREVGVALPTTTVAGLTIYLGMFYNTTDSKWDVVGVREEV
jgi:hypothetical protein